MRENRPYGSEGGESSLTGLPYPYSNATAPQFKHIEPAQAIYYRLLSHSLACASC